MSKHVTCKVLVVGGGPGGYVAAIRAGRLGLDTILVEADKVGGTCLIRGCIPSKAVIQAADRFAATAELASKGGALGISIKSKPVIDLKKTVAWKNDIVDQLNSGVSGLLQQAGVQVINGWAYFDNAKNCRVSTPDGDVHIAAESVILANGSEPVELPFLPFSDTVISSTDALDLDKVPKKLAVVGAGYIGLELGMALKKMAADVVFIEAADTILPGFDPELIAPVKKWLQAHKVKVHTNASAKALESDESGHVLVYETKAGEEEKLPVDKVLVTVGRKPKTDGWGLENMAVDMDGPFIRVDNKCRTSMKGVYAIGDIMGEPMLAHKASAQGEMVAENIAGHDYVFQPMAIPAVCFTSPEIVSVGLTPSMAQQQGYDITVGKFPWSASGRALTTGTGENGGFVRVTARADNGQILGIHAVGHHIAELSGEFVHAIEMGARLEDMAGTIHAHPTLSEALSEVSLSALGRPLHIA